MTSRCDICHDPFVCVMTDGKLVDIQDGTRHVSVSSGGYAHKRCFDQAVGAMADFVMDESKGGP